MQEHDVKMEECVVKIEEYAVKIKQKATDLWSKSEHQVDKFIEQCVTYASVYIDEVVPTATAIQVIEWLSYLDIHDVTENELEQMAIKNAFKKKLEPTSTKQTVLQITIEALKDLYDFRHDVIKDNIEYKKKSCDTWKQLTDESISSIRIELDAHGIKTSIRNIDDLLKSTCLSPDFNVFEDYFENSTWDGTDYITQIAETIPVAKEDEERRNKYIKYWMIGSVAQAIDKGSNQLCVVFTGPQSQGKTTWIKNINPFGRPYHYSGYLNPHDKDSCFSVVSNFIVNLDELESTVKKEWSFIKSLITTESFNIRSPFARRAQVHPRRASFAGSINEGHFLGDLTGNRRWAVIEPTDKLNFNFDADVLKGAWAQAYALLISGEKYWYEYEESASITSYNEKFASECPEEDLLRGKYVTDKELIDAIEAINDDNTTLRVVQSNIELMTTTKVLMSIQGEYKGNLSLKKLGTILRKKYQRVYDPKQKCYAYKMLPLNSTIESAIDYLAKRAS